MVARIIRLRGLVATLTRRELSARYRGSVLGFVWSLVNPLLLLGVYTVVFDVVFQPRMEGARPYAVFLVTGLFPWIWLATSWTESCEALSKNSGLIRKAVFPIEVLPIVGVLANLVHFLLALPIALAAVVVASVLGYEVGGWGILALPGVVALQLFFTAGVALALAALAVLFKDVRDLVANLLTLAFFLTSVLYPLAGLRAVSTALWVVVRANPVTPFVEGYHAVLFAGRVPGWELWLQMGGLALVAWAIGSWVFDRLAPTLAEAV